MTMAENNLIGPVVLEHVELSVDFKKAFDEYNLQHATNIIWKKIAELDLEIQETQPFKLIKTEKENALEIIQALVRGVYEIAIYLEPVLPDTAEKIKTLVKENKKPETPLFVRKD
jgi:methionyl-tRNA synthetase